MANYSPKDMVESLCHLLNEVSADGSIHSEKKDELIKKIKILITDLDNVGTKEKLKNGFKESSFNFSHFNKLKNFFSLFSTDLDAVKIPAVTRTNFIAQLILIDKQYNHPSPDKVELNKNENLKRLIQTYGLPEDLLKCNELLQLTGAIPEILKRTDLETYFGILKPYFDIRQKFDPAMPPSYLDKFDFCKGDDLIKENIKGLEHTLILCITNLTDKDTDISKLKLSLERSIPHFAGDYYSFSLDDVKSANKDVLFQNKLKNEEITKLNKLIQDAQELSAKASKKFEMSEK